MSRVVPVIDIESFRSGADRGSVVAAVDESCCNTGFLVITGHGIDVAVILNALRALRRKLESEYTLPLLGALALLPGEGGVKPLPPRGQPARRQKRKY